MKKILSLGLALTLVLGMLAGCSKAPAAKTAEELTTLYNTSITANGGEMVQYNPPFTAFKEEDGSEFMLTEMFKLKKDDVKALAVSGSMMNVKAYGIAAVMPAEGKEQAVKDALQSYIDFQKQTFETYLPDQRDIANAAKLETLSDGTILMVMCEGQDTVFNGIKTAIEGAY